MSAEQHSIHDAARNGWVGILTRLLEDDPTLVTCRNRIGETALHSAASAGRRDIAELLLDKGADLNAADDEGRAPLHRAVELKLQGEVAACLIARGASVDSRTRNGRTALHMAAGWSDPAAVAFLLSHGAATDVTDTDGWIALHHAAKAYNQKTASNVVRQLLEAKSNANARTNTQQIALMIAARQGDVATVNRLLGASSEIDASDSAGFTALHLAASEGKTNVIEALIAAGANVNARHSRAGTPLLLASERGHLGAMKALLRAGADVNLEAGPYNKTPLMKAVGLLESDNQCVTLLLDAGADIDAKDSLNQSVWWHIIGGRADVSALLRRYSKRSESNTEVAERVSKQTSDGLKRQAFRQLIQQVLQFFRPNAARD